VSCWTIPIFTIFFSVSANVTIILDWNNFTITGSIKTFRSGSTIPDEKSFPGCRGSQCHRLRPLDFFQVQARSDDVWLIAQSKAGDSYQMHWNVEPMDLIFHDWYFYTQTRISNIIAKVCQSTVVPEIAVITEYPQYSFTGNSLQSFTHCGLQPDIFHTGMNERLEFFEFLLGEICSIYLIANLSAWARRNTEWLIGDMPKVSSQNGDAHSKLVHHIFLKACHWPPRSTDWIGWKWTTWN
jgi:hypothetical protein